jgi:hypothetical protein
MSLGENTSTRVAYKAYATGAISSNSQPVSSSDPGASGGQILRRTRFGLNLAKDTYQATEKRVDRQLADYRHGTKRVSGPLGGELSPGTYFDFIEACMRGTRTNAIARSEAELTSVAASNSGSSFTYGGGDPVAEGYRIGMVKRFTNLSVAANNNRNFLITGFSGASNRTMSVYPAPVDMSADTAFNVTSIGKRISAPSSAFVSRKFAVEAYHTDQDVHRLFTECRVTGLNLAMPATGMSTIEIPMMGRDMEIGTAGTSPFFTAPAAATTTGLLAAVNGLVRVGGATQGVITGAQLSINLNPEAPAVSGQNIVPEIFLRELVASGQLTALFEDLTLVNYFKNETSVEVLLYLLASSDEAADFMTIHLPKVKLGGAELGLDSDAGIPITLPFQALKYEGGGAGIEQTTVAFCDSAAA